MGSSYVGQYSSGVGFAEYKAVTVPYTGTIYGVSFYVTTAPGLGSVAIYTDRNGGPWWLLASSVTQAISVGWNYITISPGTLAPAHYWIGVEVSNASRVAWSTGGIDRFGYTPFGTWTNPAQNQNILGNLAVTGYYCHY